MSQSHNIEINLIKCLWISEFNLYFNLNYLCRRQLRKAVVDHVSDSFLEPDAPLHLLIAAAKEGNEKEVDEHAQVSSY